MGCNNSSQLGNVGGSSADQRSEVSGYIIKKKFAEGNYGTVHRCEKNGKVFACKIINKRKLAYKANKEERKAMEVGLQNEIGALKVLDHPHIVKLEHVEEADDILYLVMEMMNGGELFDHIIAKNTLTEREASNIIRQVASAIDYCHKKNIIHRDLKPENLLLVEKRKLDSVKIADFGFSKAIPSGGSTKSVLGSPGYVAPEIRQGRDYGPAVDIWSLGVIMYVMLFGYMPFDCDTDVIDEDENLEQYFKLDFEEEGWQNVSQGARTLLVKMLQPDYARRPTALQVFNDPWVRGDNVSDSALPSTGHLMKNPGSRREAGKRTVDINKLADQLQRGEITLEQFQEISKGGSPAPQSSTQLADINVGGV